MKTTIKILLCASIILSSQFSIYNSACAQRSISNTTASATESVWERVNIGLTFNGTGSANFLFGSGFLKNHPERALEAFASVRLWNHLEIGGYLSLMGSSPYGYSSVHDYNGTQLYRVGWDNNGYALSGGAFIEAHLTSFAKRNTIDGAIDIKARGGFGLNGQADGLWGGVGFEYRIARQIRVVFDVDFGNFPLADLMAVCDNETSWRGVIGLKFSLR